MSRRARTRHPCADNGPHRPKLLCRVYGYLTLILVSRSVDWIKPRLREMDSSRLLSEAWRRETGVSVPYTYQLVHTRVLHADFVKYLPSSKYEVYASPVTARAHFRAPSRKEQRHNRFVNIHMHLDIKQRTMTQLYENEFIWSQFFLYFIIACIYFFFWIFYSNNRILCMFDMSYSYVYMQIFLCIHRTDCKITRRDKIYNIQKSVPKIEYNTVK